MNDINNPCPSHESLVTYLYDECEPAERTTIAAHVSICTLCTDEIHALSDTRAHLSSWSPPALPLGFQLTRTETEQPSNVLRPEWIASRSSHSVRQVSEGWWRQPLPAWAQAAAAVVIFAAGMSAGAFRSTPADDRVAASTPKAVVSQPQIATVSQEDVEALEARLLAVERHQARPDVVQVARGVGGVEDRQQVEHLVSLIDDRVRQSDQLNTRDLKRMADTVETYRASLDERLSQVEQEQQEVRQAFSRGLGPSSLVRAASLR